MKRRHDILITIEQGHGAGVSRRRMERLARAVLEAEGLPPAEVGVLVTSDDAVRELNRRYAGEDEPTDVLSFSLREGEEFASPDRLIRLGEVIISRPTAERQARAAARSTGDEIAHLLVHGILHLLGYDHAEPGDERRMRTRERELLAAMAP